MTDELSSDQNTFLEAACKLADRFNDYQVDEEALMNQLTWDEEKFTRIRNELEDAAYITRKGAPQIPTTGGFWIEKPGIDLCPESLGGRDALQSRE